MQDLEPGERLKKGENTLGNYTRNSFPRIGEKWARLAMSRKLLSGQRVAKCIWLRTKFAVEVWRNLQSRSAHFRGVVTCGSVWVCPACAEKISQYRQAEMQAALIAARRRGWFVSMMTFTIAHELGDPLSETLKDLNHVVRRMAQHRDWGEIKKRFGLGLCITALENTWSEDHGWHPHKHRIYFHDRELNVAELEELRQAAYSIYGKLAAKRGRKTVSKFAVDLRPGNDYAAEYIAKYGRQPSCDDVRGGLSYEVSRSALKTSGAAYGHFTPFQLLDLAIEGSESAASLFVEFGHAIKGRQQLVFSAALRKELGLMDAKDDETIASLMDDDSDCFASLLDEAWKVARLRPADVLNAARDAVTFVEFAAWCRSKGFEVESPVIELPSEWHGSILRFA